MPELPELPELAPTPGQTVGPFFHYALPFPGDRELVPRAQPGSVRLHGYVYDGHGAPVPDALLEIRQADTQGIVPRVAGSLRREGAPFTGWGRSTTDRTGHYWFSTVEPAAPFIAMTVFARGLLDRLFTRIYLPTEPEALAADPLLAGLGPDEQQRLVATWEDDPSTGSGQVASLRFDVHLQGERESVFLSYPRGR